MPIFVGYNGEWTPIKDLYGKGASGEWEAAEAIYVGVNGEWVLVEDEYVPPPTHPTVIGEFFGGGYYIGNVTIPEGEDQGTYAVIMAGLEGQGQRVLKSGPAAFTSGTESLTNGLANTQAMQADDPEIHFAAMYCLEYRGGGHTDWYLPAKDELDLAFVNRGGLAILSMGVPQAYYWTSSQYSARDNWAQRFPSNHPINYTKFDNLMVRPVRRIKLPNP